MFFLIRCAFWLTIVFHAMTWPEGTRSAIPFAPLNWPAQTAPTDVQPTPTRVSPAATSKLALDGASGVASVAGRAVAAKLEQECFKAPADCLALAAQLPRIGTVNRAQDIPSALPPKRPWHLAQSEAAHPAAASKALSQHN